MGKRAFLFGLALLATVSVSGCKSPSEKNGKEDNSTTVTDETTTAKENTVSETTTRRKNKEKTGMLGYVEKSKQSSANANAKTLYHSVMSVLTDDEKKIANDIIYTKTGEGEFGEKVNKYFIELDPLEYIVIPDEHGQPKVVLCCSGTSRKDKVGIYGDIEDADDIKELKWKKVLEKFGLEYGKYTDIELEKFDYSSNYSYTHEEPQGIDFEDVDALESCDLASAIAWEYNLGETDIPVYLYGKWSKDTVFTADIDWEIPKHGDIEYVIEFNGFSVSKVFCWDTERDKKYVGDTDFGYGYTNFVDKTWDDVLEYYGYKQGEYVEY